MPPSGTSRSPGRGGRTSQFAPTIHVVQSVRGSRAGAGSGVQATRNSPNTALPRSPVGTTSTVASRTARVTRRRSNATSAIQPSATGGPPHPPRARREWHAAPPAARVSWAAIRGMVVKGEAELGAVRPEPRLRKGEERPHQPAAPARGDTGEARRRAPFQKPEQNRLDLVVPLMRGHQVARPMPALDLAEPPIARPSRDGLRGVRTETQLADLERQLVPLGQLGDGPCDRPTVQSNAVIDVGDDERQAELGGEGVKEVQQRYGVGAA